MNNFLQEQFNKDIEQSISESEKMVIILKYLNICSMKHIIKMEYNLPFY